MKEPIALVNQHIVKAIEQYLTRAVAFNYSMIETMKTLERPVSPRGNGAVIAGHG